MKGILGLTAAAVLVVLQLAGFAAWRLQATSELTPVEGVENISQGHA